MDVGAFVQENKRWIAGSALGAIVWFIAGAVIDSMNDPSGVRFSPKKAGAPSQLYDKPALEAARAEGEQLAAERKRLQAELAFVPSAKYVADGKGSPEEYLYEVRRALRQSILTEANRREVAIAEKDLKSELPKADEIRGMLIGLELMDETSRRLFAAHDAVRAARPEAIGLRSILSLKLGVRAAPRPGARPARPGEIDLRGKVEQEQLAFSFQSDEAVLAAFFEACRQPQRTLAIQTWKVEKPTRPGEPCTVSGTLQAIIFKDK